MDKKSLHVNHSAWVLVWQGNGGGGGFAVPALLLIQRVAPSQVHQSYSKKEVKIRLV